MGVPFESTTLNGGAPLFTPMRTVPRLTMSLIDCASAASADTASSTPVNTLHTISIFLDMLSSVQVTASIRGWRHPRRCAIEFGPIALRPRFHSRLPLIRQPLGTARGECFLRVLLCGRAPETRNGSCFGVERVGPRLVDAFVDDLLDSLERPHRMRCNLRGEREGAIEMLSGRMDRVDHAEIEALSRIQPPSRHRQQLGLRRTDEPRQALRPAPSRQAREGHLGKSELRGLACDAEVAGECKLETAAECEPIDRGNCRLGHAREAI